MKKVFALISVFALAMGAMAGVALPSKTLTVDLSLPVTNNEISQNGVVVSNVAEIQNSMGEVWLLAAGELTVSLAGGYDILGIVLPHSQDGKVKVQIL